MKKHSDDRIDRVVVLARLLRVVDKIISEAKTMERDREELRRLLAEKEPEASPC